jgi:ribosomal protein L37AE/L43A
LHIRFVSRYRLAPTPEQEIILRRHCADARFVWNLAVEQQSWWRPGRGKAPGYCVQAAQLTMARADHIRRLSRHSGEVRVPKAGWVRFRWSRAGELLHCPGLREAERVRLWRLQRKFARAQRGSARRRQVKIAIAKLKAREADRRKDWAEKISTGLARQFDIVRLEDLNILAMTRSARGTTVQPGRNVRQKAGLNRSIRASGWGLLASRLEEKAAGRVEKVDPAYTSQRCSACGTVDAKARESQAVFACRSCGYACNADVNAARNIAAGHAVTARGRPPLGGRMNREPRHLAS